MATRLCLHRNYRSREKALVFASCFPQASSWPPWGPGAKLDRILQALLNVIVCVCKMVVMNSQLVVPRVQQLQPPLTSLLSYWLHLEHVSVLWRLAFILHTVAVAGSYNFGLIGDAGGGGKDISWNNYSLLPWSTNSSSYLYGLLAILYNYVPPPHIYDLGRFCKAEILRFVIEYKL